MTAPHEHCFWTVDLRRLGWSVVVLSRSELQGWCPDAFERRFYSLQGESCMTEESMNVLQDHWGVISSKQKVGHAVLLSPPEMGLSDAEMREQVDYLLAPAPELTAV